MTELVVGATLLLALISFIAPLAVRSGRLWQDTNRTRIALDELTNQLETLNRLDEPLRRAALAELAVSPQVASQLPDAELRGELVNDVDGTRVILTLLWDRIRPAKPVSLVAWVDSLPPDAENTAAESTEADAEADDVPTEQEVTSS